MKQLHCAYNLTTGEIVTTATGNALKRHIRVINQVSDELGYPHGKWIYGHKGIDAICDKARGLSGMERSDLI